MNSATVRAPRSSKPAVFTVSDLQKCLTSSDDQLLRRWEQIARERRA